MYHMEVKTPLLPAVKIVYCTGVMWYTTSETDHIDGIWS